MKKYFLSIVALAGMLFATSCQESLVEPQVDGTTTFTVQLPDGMGTKAYGDEASTQATINRLYVEVYSKDGNTLVYEPLSAIEMDDATATVTLDLVSTQEYDIIFWAQNEFCTYDVTDLRSVKMNANHHNSETGAAFYAVLNDYKPVNGQQGVTLTRPFAQLNLATTTEVSYANGINGTNNKVTIESAKITVKGVAPSFDRINGQTNGEGYAPALSNEVTYTYENTDATTNFSKAAGEIEVAGKKYQYVSMDYFAVPGNQSTVQVTAEIKVKDPNGVESTITRVIESVPVQLNFKTNIVGNLITSATEFEVIVEEGWAGTNDKEVEFRDVATQEELQDAIEEGVDNITLVDDIVLTESLVFSAIPSQNPIARAAADIPEFVLDLNGKNISGVDNSIESYGLITNKANLIITGEGTISLSATNNRGWNAYSSVISNQPGGNLTVKEGVIIEHIGGTDMAYGIDNLTNGKGTSAITTVDGATVKSTYRAIRQFLNGVEAANELYVKAGSTILNTTGTNKGIWMQDPSKNANTGKLVVEEGAHVDDVYLDVLEGSKEWPIEVSVAASSLNDGKTVIAELPQYYELVLEDGFYFVRRPVVGTILELKGQKGVIFSINEKEIKAVSVAEQNLNGKTWQGAMDWAAGLGEGWYLASMEDLNAIYELRCELNDVLEADNADNALFWEGDELYIKNGSVYYALYISSTEVEAGELDANGNEYFANRVFFKIFNDLGYSDVLYSAFDCINKYAPLRDNYFARGVYIIER